MYTLTVLETAVKNGDQRFKALVCQKEFVTDLVKLISSKYEVPQIIQERILGLIQANNIITKLILWISINCFVLGLGSFNPLTWFFLSFISDILF